MTLICILCKEDDDYIIEVSDKCADCSNGICQAHFNTCNTCDRLSCGECGDECPKCNAEICKSCKKKKDCKSCNES